ncbi:hypothetical protein [Chroococcidiopsis sp.]
MSHKLLRRLSYIALAELGVVRSHHQPTPFVFNFNLQQHDR